MSEDKKKDRIVEVPLKPGFKAGVFRRFKGHGSASDLTKDDFVCGVVLYSKEVP